jgi:hypothetical protein
MTLERITWIFIAVETSDACYLFCVITQHHRHPVSLLYLIFLLPTSYGGSWFLRNGDAFLPNRMMSHKKRQRWHEFDCVTVWFLINTGCPCARKFYRVGSILMPGQQERPRLPQKTRRFYDTVPTKCAILQYTVSRVKCWNSQHVSVLFGSSSRSIHQWNTYIRLLSVRYKVVQIWPGLIVCKQVTVCPGHIWTTL